MFQMNPRWMAAVTWFALVLCLSTTMDVVIDLVFEAPEGSLLADGTVEEPDNAAEHVLMPSSRADSSSDVTAFDSADVDSSSTVLSVSSNAVQRAVSSIDYPPRNGPISFSVPLRI